MTSLVCVLANQGLGAALVISVRMGILTSMPRTVMSALVVSVITIQVIADQPLDMNCEKSTVLLMDFSWMAGLVQPRQELQFRSHSLFSRDHLLFPDACVIAVIPFSLDQMG